MQIEFIGAPASGKTSTVRKLVQMGIPRALADFPKTRTPCHDLVRANVRAPSLRAKTLRALDQRAAHRGPGWRVVDEGVIQFCVSIAIRQDWEWYIETCPKPDILVYLACSGKVIRDRNTKRYKDRSNGNDLDGRKKMHKSGRALDRIPEIIDRLDEVNILTYRSDTQPIDEIADAIMAHVYP